MPQLLIELFSEEIPARMQQRAAADLLRLLESQLKEAGLTGERARAFAGPRRLVAVIDGLPLRTPDLREERKGPRVGAPEQALAGFLKAAGLPSIDQAVVQDDPKGAFYVARIDKPGRLATEILAEALRAVAKNFPWPKSMRSGDADFYWVRPLQSIAALFDGQVIPCEIGGIKSGRITRGHRFHAPSSFEVSDFEDYEDKLRASWVVLDQAERKAQILERAIKLCAGAGLELVEDLGLLDEVSGLVEWPVPVLGKMDPDFLDLPADVIRLSMRTHQKYFAVRDPTSGGLAPNFVTVANIDAKDGGRAIAAGNARVLSARLNDARFFWDGDRKTPLFTEERKAKLEKIVFHQKLGSVWDKVERVRALAKELCAATGADPALVDRAALLSKCDLVTETVGEFPELQGQIGRQLAERQGEHASVAIALEDHYRPLGPNDRTPADPVAVTLALADKIDTLVGFWAIDEKPTGSKDPFALRRAALGMVRIILSNNLRLSIFLSLSKPMAKNRVRVRIVEEESFASRLGGVREFSDQLKRQFLNAAREQSIQDETSPEAAEQAWARSTDLVRFILERLDVQLRDQGKRHDLIGAALKPAGALDDDLVRIVRRVEALEDFLKTDDGVNLLAGYKRAVNILRAEEKKEPGLAQALAAGGDAGGEIQAGPGASVPEQTLASALQAAGREAAAALQNEDFAGAMGALAALRGPVDVFFEQVLVNDPDPMLRRNRLLLLSKVRAALEEVADFSQIEG